MLTRFPLIAACMLSWALAGGCTSQSSQHANPTGEQTTTATVSVPPPPGIEAAAVTPWTGDALTKAKLPLDRIVASLPSPSYLAPATTTQPAATPNAEPPRAAQQAYAKGREEWLAHRGFDAIRDLQTAESLAPDRAEILRLLGQIYMLSGNKVRGGYYLEKAVRADPKDIESLFMLGQFALEQGRWDSAIVIYAYILNHRGAAPDADAAMWPLVSFSLAGALDHQGYDAAAIEQYTVPAEVPDIFGRTTRLGREVAFLSRQRASVWQALGDAENRMGNPAAALQAYRRSAELSQKDEVEPDLPNRIVYTLLRLGRRDAAVDAGVDYVHTSQGDPQSLELLKYLSAHGVDKSRLSARLENAYPRTGRPPQMTIALASLLGGEKGRTLLASHLAAKPEDRAVFQELVKEYFAETADSTTAQVQAILIGAKAIAAKPGLARDYSNILIQATDDQDKLRSALNVAAGDTHYQAIIHYMRGRSLTKSRRIKEAIKEYEAAGSGPDGLVIARVDQAQQLLLTGQADKASKVLDTLGDRNDAEVTSLRVEVLAETGRASDALKLLETMIAKQPLNTDLMVEKAALQRVMNDSAGAERTLEDALDIRPTSEPIYAALFNLYDSNQAPPDALQQYQRLMMRMLRTIPQSRLARLKNAEVLSAERQFDQAEQILRTLLAEDAKDYDALDMLLDVLASAGKRDDADTLIHKRMTDSPKDDQLFRVAYRFYRVRVKDMRRADEVEEQYLLAQPASKERSVGLSQVYARTHREAQAEQELHHALDQFPTEKPDLLFELAELHSRMGQRDRSEQELSDLLKQYPDHAAANNALGYVWADRGVHLEQAKAMLQRAVDAEPNAAAYLDSMGWVCYKLGQFAEAVKWLQRARAAPDGENAVIVEHMGDALYRTGLPNDAVNNWQHAQAMAAQIDPDDAVEDPDLAGIGPRLSAKILAVRQRRAAPVAEVPSGTATQPKP